MTENRKSTARSRYFGAEFGLYREAGNVTAAELAKRMGWTPSVVEQIEAGERDCPQIELATCLALCGVLGDEQEVMLALGRAKDDPWWTCPHADGGPDDLAGFWFTWRTAARVTCWYPGTLPELLQTREFAEWQLRSQFGPGTAVAELWVGQQRRQQEYLLRRPPAPTLTFYLQETMFRSIPKDKTIRGGQLAHLATLIAQDLVRIKVVPTRANHCLPASGRFWLFEFPQFSPVVCAQSDLVSAFGQRERDIAGYEDRLQGLDAIALSEQDSRRLITAGSS